MLPDLVRRELLRELGLLPKRFELLGLIPDKIRKILAGTCFVLGAILASFVNANLTGTDGFFEMIIFLFGVFLLIISPFLWPWGSTAKDIKAYVDAQVTDEEQDRMWELSRYPRSNEGMELHQPDWSSIIRFADVGGWDFRVEHGLARGRNCGFIQVFSIEEGTEADDHILLFSFGPTNEGDYGDKKDLRQCIEMIAKGSDWGRYNDWWTNLFEFLVPEATYSEYNDRKKVVAVGQEYILSNCGFRFIDLGTELNVWEHCWETDETGCRLVPEYFSTYGTHSPMKPKILDATRSKITPADSSGFFNW